MKINKIFNEQVARRIVATCLVVFFVASTIMFLHVMICMIIAGCK